MQPPVEKLAVMSRHRLFLSHSSTDVEIVREISRLLEVGLQLTSENIFCSSIPGQGIAGGQRIEFSLWEKINASAIVLFIVSDSFIRSAYCMCELGAVWGARKRFIPIVVPPMTRSDLPGILSGVQAYDIGKDRDLDLVKDDLVAVFPYLRRKGGSAKWNDAKDSFNKEAVRLISQFSPERTAGHALVNGLSAKFFRIAKKAKETLYIKEEEATSFFVLMFDVDKLTQLNKLYGYKIGNLILSEMSELLARSDRFIECKRCGDDTFFGILLASEAGAMAFATRIIGEAAARLSAAAKVSYKIDITVSVSCGVSDVVKCPEGLWFQCGFYACNQAKIAGGGRVFLSDGQFYMNWS